MRRQEIKTTSSRVKSVRSAPHARRITTGAWPITVRIGTEVLVRSGPSSTGYVIADFGGG